MSLEPVRVPWHDELSRPGRRAFEHLLAGHYRDAGYDVEQRGTGGARHDDGVDLVLRGDGETTLVQCRDWTAAQVPHDAVHELLGLIVTRGATDGILVSGGEFTAAARRAAMRSRCIRLIDGTRLRTMIDPARIPASPPADAARPAADDGRPPASLFDDLKSLGLRAVLVLVLALAAIFVLRHWLVPPTSPPTGAVAAAGGGVSASPAAEPSLPGRRA